MPAVFSHKLCLALACCAALAACKSSEERAAEHYESGQRLVEAGDPERALVEFRNALKFSDGRNLDAYRAIGQISLDKGSLLGAYRNYLRVAEQMPEDVETLIILSQLSFLSQQWDSLEKHGTAVTALAPENPEVQAIDIAIRYRAALLDEDKPAQDAILAEAKELATTLPDDEVLRTVRINGYAADNDYENALTLVNEEILAKPDKLDLRTGKIELLARLGREAEMEAEMRAAADLFPEEAEPKTILMRYLMARDRQDDAEQFLRELIEKAPAKDRNAAYSSLIQFQLSTQGADVALAELDAEIERNPTADVLRTLRASINFDQGSTSEAIAELEELTTKEDSNFEASELANIKVTLARMLISTGNKVGARQLVEGVLEDDPRAASALRISAAWLIDEDKTDQAISALRIALEEEPDDADSLVLMSQAYARGGNSDLQLNFLSQAVEASNTAPEFALRYAKELVRKGEYLQAESTLIASLRLTPGHVELLTALGQVYLRLEDVARAEQVVETLGRIDNPTAQRNSRSLKVDVLALKSGSDQAIEFLQNLASQGGENAVSAKLALIRARIQSGNPAMALDEMKKIAADDPDNLVLKNALALTYLANDDYTQAADLLEEIVTTDPTATGSWMQLVRVYSSTGQDEKMVDTIERGLAASPENPDLRWAKASNLQRLGDIDGAIEVYEALYSEFSSFPILANNLASLLSVYRDDPETLERATVIARRLNGTDVPAFQDTYGWILYLNGNFEEAFEYLEPAAESLPADLRVQYHLAMVLDGLGQKTESLDKLRKTLASVGPLDDQDLADTIRAKITELETASQEASNN